jgi:hypothetical protein
LAETPSVDVDRKNEQAFRKPAACGPLRWGPPRRSRARQALSRRSAFTRIQTRVAMHAIGVLPKDCQPQLSTRRSRRSLAWGVAPPPHHQTSSYKARDRDTAPHPARHSRRKRRRKGVVGPIGSATETNRSVATQFYRRICVRKMRDLLDPSNDSPFRRWSKTLW